MGSARIGLRVFDPGMVVTPPELAAPQVREVRDLIKNSRREASGRNGEFAFLARHDLGLDLSPTVRWWRRRRTLARMKKWVAALGPAAPPQSVPLADKSDVVDQA